MKIIDVKGVHYPALEREMDARGVTKTQVHQALGISCKSFYNKRGGVTPFTLEEAMTIRDKFFPDMVLEELFAKE